MIIHVHIVTCNEEQVLPWALAHYSVFADRIFVHDDASTDRTLEIARANPLVTVVPNDRWREDGYRDDLMCELKQTVWQQYPCDWAVVVDCDELLFGNGVPVRQLLARFGRDGVVVPRPVGYNMTGREVPPWTLGAQIYHSIRRGALSDQYSKCCVINARRVKAIRYGCGCHTGTFDLDDGTALEAQTLDREPRLQLLHFKQIGGAYGYLKRCEWFARRLSQVNLDNGWGKHNLPALYNPDRLIGAYTNYENLAAVVPGLERPPAPKPTVQPTRFAEPPPVMPFAQQDQPELVVARYNEDVSWALAMAAESMPVTIYDKSEQKIPDGTCGARVIHLPNEGRESQTWLYHFLTRYESLAPVTFLSQGDPFFHAPDFFDRLRVPYDRPVTLTVRGSGRDCSAADLAGGHHGLETRLARVADQDRHAVWGRVFQGEPPDPMHYGYGMMWAVPGACVAGRPLEAWQWLYRRRMAAWQAGTEFSHLAPGVNGFVMEALFGYLLDPENRFLCEASS